MLLLCSLIILWTLAEATIFWVAPDIAIAVAYVYLPKAWRRYLLLGLLGALLGCLITYTWAFYDGDGWLAYVSGLRFHNEHNIQYVNSVIEQDPFAIIKGAWGGIPFKLFIGLSAIHHKALLPLVVYGMISRAIRFTFVLAVTIGLRKMLKPWSVKNPGKMALLLLTIWFSMIAIFDIWINKAFLVQSLG